MREARDAVNTMIEQGEITVTLPTIEDTYALTGELAECGVAGNVSLQQVQSRRQIHWRLSEESS